MSQWKPCKRRDFIRKLHKLGFANILVPVVFEIHRLAIPSNAEYSMQQLWMMIREVEEILNRKINLNEWDKL